MKPSFPAPAAVLLGGLLVFLPGCGGDDGGGGGGNDHLVIDLRNGTWETSYLTTFSGEDPQCAEPDESGAETDTLCAQDVAEFVDIEGLPFGLDCTFEGGDGTFSIDCSGSASVPGCKVSVQVEGMGQYSQTSFTVTASAVVLTEGSDPDCAAPDCVVTTTYTGTWKSADGAETCADNAAGPPGSVRVPAEALVRSALSRVLR